MDHLILLSSDCPISPTLLLEAPIKKVDEKSIDADDIKQYVHAWGVSWYPPDDSTVTSIKEVQQSPSSVFGLVLKDWEQFHSSLFFCYLRRATVKIVRQYVQPYTRTYAAQDWTMILVGNLPKNIREILPLGDNPFFEPIGKSPSEYAFCWVLTQIREKHGRSLSEVPHNFLYEIAQKINEIGIATFSLSDGKDILVYQDKELRRPLYYHRLIPPVDTTQFAMEGFKLDIGRDSNRTFMLFTTVMPNNQSWASMQKAQMLIVRQGQILWDSNKDVSSISAKGAELQIKTAEPEGMTGVETISTKLSDTYSDLIKTIPEEIPAEESLFQVSHETIYHYSNPVEFSQHYIRLYPIIDRNQEVLEHQITITDNPFVELFEDVFGNITGLFLTKKPFEELIIKMTAKVLVKAPSEHLLGSPYLQQKLPIVWMPWQRQIMLSYLLPPELPESQLSELYVFANSFVERNDNDVFAVLNDINQTIYQDFSYQTGSTTLQTTPYDVYIHRRGVCQDFANLFICLSRLLSIPARYRVGYIYTGQNYDRKIQSDASHAWVEVYLPWVGWMGYDPTNGCIVGNEHVRVSCGRNYYDPPPTSGTIYKGGGEEKLTVSVKVKDLKLKPKQ